MHAHTCTDGRTHAHISHMQRHTEVHMYMCVGLSLANRSLQAQVRVAEQISTKHKWRGGEKRWVERARPG